MKKLVKQDISFLGRPLWMQDDRASEGLVWTDLDGFVYKTSAKPPTKTDAIFLYYLLMNSQENDWNEKLEVTQYECLKGCGIQPGKYWRDRLKESLERWMHVVVTFEGTFYDGKKHVDGIVQFHILDKWIFNKGTKKLEIYFSSDWLYQIKHSTYFKMLDFDQIKALRSPLATRLYEILIKSFQTRNDWSCGARKLAAKIPMKEEYPADIIPKIKTAVERINEKTDLQIQLTVRRPKRGKAIFDFEKLANRSKSSTEAQDSPKTKPHIVDVPPEQAENFKELLDLLPSKEQGKKTLRELIARKLRKEGPDFVRRNILYANKNANTNYRLYLTKAFKEDWGEAYEEDRREEQAARQAKQAAEEEQRRKQREQERIEKQAREALHEMTPEEKQALEDEARAKLELTNPTMLQGSFASVALKIQMNALLIERFQTSTFDSGGED